MNLILLSDVRKVGHRGQVVMVADGYAQNYLIPRHLAVQATPSALKAHATDVARAQEAATINMARAKELTARLSDKTLSIAVTSSETGTLFEALKAEDIAREIKTQWALDVPEQAIHLDTPIKARGTYRIPLELGQERIELEVVV